MFIFYLGDHELVGYEENSSVKLFQDSRTYIRLFMQESDSTEHTKALENQTSKLITGQVPA